MTKNRVKRNSGLISCRQSKPDAVMMDVVEEAKGLGVAPSWYENYPELRSSKAD
jgi:hypothetical protein